MKKLAIFCLIILAAQVNLFGYNKADLIEQIEQIELAFYQACNNYRSSLSLKPAIFTQQGQLLNREHSHKINKPFRLILAALEQYHRPADSLKKQEIAHKNHTERLKKIAKCISQYYYGMSGQEIVAGGFTWRPNDAVNLAARILNAFLNSPLHKAAIEDSYQKYPDLYIVIGADITEGVVCMTIAFINIKKYNQRGAVN